MNEMLSTSQGPFSAVNWNRPEDAYTKMFWDQNVRQFWVDEEIPLADDKLSWMTLAPEEKRAYEEVLAGLTLLDTLQGGVGMPRISQWVEGLQAKAVLSFMGAMEHMHAKSYSSIFSTLCTSERIEELFTWVREQPELQAKLALIHEAYTGIRDGATLYRAMAASVLLESYLFYSGFFYPLYLAGGGRLVNSGEIISLIIRDEAVHGVYVGLLAQERAAGMGEVGRKRAQGEVIGLLERLDALEARYTKALYAPIGLEEAVLRFSRYNADKALMNLGMEPHFGVEPEEVNPVVLAGLRTETKHHDFFSTKGNGYIKATRVEPLSDLDFYFPEGGPDLKPVRKRDGREVPFDEMRIVRAVGKAAAAAGVTVEPERIARGVVEPIKRRAEAKCLSVEEIQDLVEEGLMATYPEVARAYILYREARTRARRGEA
ncbi:Ribonucleoside-diphosphate reductase subunit beta [Meiothermus luteus]|jgi:ribonucleoside-diphosphate reductase beta chain|uniref:ribonucleoside-diphosphate reductase n=1 Tax=Meiothermus luteus TaxID=2026184 RepID=A0A399EXY3_9DEIN|nr:class 1b ribonucleoside-diphosphate reductase subunit beta [Meiothermus luteus]RIH88603.1 Ribonucleoside-diphosphate reductase subunit beta [Meiothermus luteus]RMH57471.1 MAG: class 1b ribonucleoside-diphosphate reductase subunit beta [Deinococcota bacterium]